MNQDDKKNAVALAALEFIENGQVIGIGSGSTVNSFISHLASIKTKIDGAVSSSQHSTKLLEENDIRVFDLKEIGQLPLYFDGADESNNNKQLIKGGGGALTREKIVAQASKKFICMVDDSKIVKTLGAFPLPIEVIKMAQSHVAMEMIKINGRPVLRENFITDNGNIILDIHNLSVAEPLKLEQQINNIPGVVTNGIFAIRPADEVLIANESGIEFIKN